MTAPSYTFAPKSNDKKSFQFIPILTILAIFVLFEGGLQCYRSLQISHLDIEIIELKERLNILENERRIRVKRQADQSNLYEDGVPIRQGSYQEKDQGDSEGMRVYDAWFQHRNAKNIPKSRVGAASRKKISDYQNPIKPHHRYSNLSSLYLCIL